MGRFFNTAGPCQPNIHYTLDPLARLSATRALIEEQKYFILHAPRQTGKTTVMMALAKTLNEEGKFATVYANVEPAQAVRHDVEMANQAFVEAVAENARFFLPKDYWPSEEALSAKRSSEQFRTFLQRWCAELPKPLVLFIDEADALIGDSLLSLLRQLRSGYALRPTAFPHSVALIGLRDIRDYRIYSEHDKRFIIGGSAFNIKDESLTLGNFSPSEVRELYAQHSAETGQAFSEDALNLIFEQTQGQPWLVNAIGKQLCFGPHKPPADQTIEVPDVRRAVEALILRRDTHLDHLADKLTEPRVARIVDLILSGHSPGETNDISNDDLQYVLDLGLVVKSPQGLSIANPIYREVVPRELTTVTEAFLPMQRAWYVGDDGKLNIEAVLERFFEFYRENGEMIANRNTYIESAYHLTFMAWLQRIVNGGGYIRREYAAGLGFLDLLIEYAGDKFAFELKTEQNFKRQKALDQIARYMRRMSVEEGYLVVFRQHMANPEAVGERERVVHEGMTVHVIWV